ncbi:hypothetical protein BSKO_07820 [Bryopsis sp. KO-2023]|nr:hypothetical protein BSKO_07820 [Bryopsis sp. KO-2023]
MLSSAPATATKMQALGKFSQHHHLQAFQEHIRVPLSTGAASPCMRPTPRRGVRLAASSTEVSESETAAASSQNASKTALGTCYGTIDFEQIDEIPVEVEGKIPEWLKGTLLLNGCGDYTVMKHMFDGFALLHKWRISEEGVFTSHRFLQTEAYKHYKATGKLKWKEFAASPEGSNVFTNIVLFASMGLFGKQATTDNASVSVIPFGGKVLAVSEPKTAAFEIDMDTMTVVEQMAPDVKGDTVTAHPFITEQGDIINVASDFAKGYTVYRQNKSTFECEEVGFVPLQAPFVASWIHDFPATNNYAAIVETPCNINFSALMLETPSEYGMMKWNPDACTFVHLVPLKGEGKVRTFRCPTFFNYHFGNAFESEDGKRFCFDVAMYKDLKTLVDNRLDVILEGGNDMAESMLCRIEVPLEGDGGVLKWEPLVKPEMHGKYCDFPTINDRFRGKKHRYVYMTGASRPTCNGNCLVKADVEEGTCKVWNRGYLAGEPCFVEAPNPTSEDDGVVISSCMGPDGTTSLVILDAKTWEEVAVAKMPYGIPARFHGHFFGQE